MRSYYINFHGYGVATSTEVAYYTYIYAKVRFHKRSFVKPFAHA